MADKKSLGHEFTKGIIKENPVLRLVLGTCPTLATTTSLESAIGMGISAMIVLVCSNIVISALRKVLPSLDEQLGVYLPLIVVNCIILGRAEAFAGKNSVVASALDGLGMGVGFTCALAIMGTIRELLGSGSLYGHAILPESIPPMTIFVLAPGGFFVFGLVMACANKLAEAGGGKKATLGGCKACPMASSCEKLAAGEKCGEKEVEK